MDELIRVLEKTVSPSQDDQNKAIQYIEACVQQDFGGFLKHLSDILYNTSNQPTVRLAAGLQLKNRLTARDEVVKLAQQEKWRGLPQETRLYIKDRVFRALGTEDSRPSSAPQCVANIAITELPCQEWPGLIDALVLNVTNPASTDAIRQSTLEAIGYICAEIDQSCLKPTECNGILTAIVSGMQHNENSVKLAATSALLNSLEFTEANFQNKQERDYIMTVVCQTTQCNDNFVRVAALQCLVKIMSLYYHFMEYYMNAALFSITMNAMASDIDEIALQGIEFWSNVCDEEITLANEAQEAREQNRQPQRLSKHYANSALQALVPVLIEMLAKQEEGDDSEDWKPCKAAGVCLILLANCCENAIVGHVLPFIKKDIVSDDWRHRDAAIMTFGSILDGPDPITLKPIAESIVPYIIRFMRDTSVVVRDTSAWALGKLCDTVPQSVLSPTLLDPIATALIENLSNEPRVATNVCWAFNSLISAATIIARENYGSHGENTYPPTFLLSNYFVKIVTELIKATDRQDSGRDEFDVKNASYHALMTAIQCAPEDCYSIVYPSIYDEIMRRIVILNQLLSTNTHSTEQRAQLNENQALLWSTMQSLIKRMSRENIIKHCDEIVCQLLRSISGCPDSPSVIEDSLMAASKLIDRITAEFDRYFDSFKPCLVEAIRTCQAPQINTVALNILGELADKIPDKIISCINDFMSLMFQLLNDNQYDKMSKAQILSIFGDFALFFNMKFEPYVETALTMLHTASQVELTDRNDYEMAEYCLKLRENVVESYTSIIQGMKSSTDLNETRRMQTMLLNHVPLILQYAVRLMHDPDTTEDLLGSICALVGDIAADYGQYPQIRSLVTSNEIIALLKKGKLSQSVKNQKLAKWAMDHVKKLQPQQH